MRRLRLFIIASLVVAVTSAVFAATAAAKPLITNITGTANTSWTTTGGGGDQVVDGSAGLWTGGFGAEPCGNDTLAVTMKVHGEGGVSLNYQIQTTDIGFYDWFDASLDTPSGTVPLVSGYNPNPDLFVLFVGPVESLNVDLTPYKGQTVTLNLAAHQDCFGDQFQVLITNLTTFGLEDED
jgi:hypothetical protein